MLKNIATAMVNAVIIIPAVLLLPVVAVVLMYAVETDDGDED